MPIKLGEAAVRTAAAWCPSFVALVWPCLVAIGIFCAL